VTTLVTGAGGFLGGHLTRVLAARGERIRILVRPGADLSRLRSLVAEVVEGDIRDDRAVRSAAAGCRLVFHLAGVVSHNRRDLPLMRAINVGGTQLLLASVEPGARVVHISSVASIGPVTSPDLRADEEHASPPSRLP
jgi:dihydroflavonol-4-reductase